jgi:hypothetical protein
MTEQLFTSVCNISSNFNGWPAIMQQSQKFNSGMLESFDFLSKGNSKLIKQQSLHDKGMGVVLLHELGAEYILGIMSWTPLQEKLNAMSLHLISWAEDGPHHHEDLSGRVRVQIMVLVGHLDGGLLALMAAARALKSKVSIQVLALCPCDSIL